MLSPYSVIQTLTGSCDDIVHGRDVCNSWHCEEDSVLNFLIKGWLCDLLVLGSVSAL